MHRFFVDKEQIQDNNIIITGSDIRHIRDVLRLELGNKIMLVSQGHNYICQIGDFNNKYITTNILEDFPGKQEPDLDIILYQGIAKGDKMDYIIQKNVELGVKEFYPISTHRTIVRFKDEKRKENRVKRWRAISEEAAKQSKRDIIPQINNIIDFNEMIKILKDEENILVPYEGEKSFSLKELRGLKVDKVHIIIGPEGGFEDGEIAALEGIGGKILTLGPRILRTETAGLVVSSILLYEFGGLEMIK